MTDTTGCPQSRRAMRGLACALALAATLPAWACGDTGSIDRERLLDEYSRSVAVAAIVDVCSVRFPAMTQALEEQQARWDARLQHLPQSRDVAASLPAQERAAIDTEARKRALERFDGETRGLDPERACRWYIEDGIEMASLMKSQGCTHDEPGEAMEHFEILLRDAQLQRAVVQCRRESAALGEHAAANAAAWEANNAALAKARHALKDRSPPMIIELHARGMVDEMFAWQRAAHGAESTCTDVAETFAAAYNSPPNHDADAMSYEGALGQFLGKMLMVKVMAPMCSARYPAMSTEIASAIDQWNRREAAFIAATQEFVASGDDKYRAELADDEEHMRRGMAFMLDRHPDNAEENCRYLFTDSASGSWRTREPELFQTLSNGRPAD